MEALQTITHRGYTIEVHQDENPMDPREWSNVSVMALFHNRYSLPNESGLDARDFQGWAEMKAEIEKVAVGPVLAVYMIDHSGLAFRCRDFSDCDPGGWDSGQVGFIYATRKTLDECGTPEDRIRECLEQEVETFSDYHEGRVYGFVIKDRDGDVEDSCWGFFGDTKDLIAEAKATVEYSANAADLKASLAVL